MPMYPKVKVREQEEDDQDDFIDVFTPEKDRLDEASEIIAKIPKSYLPNTPMPTIAVSTGPNKDSKKVDENDKLNIRASPIPRPRAVLSSPDNDVMTASKSNTREGKSSTLKNQSMGQTARSKVVRAHISVESPRSTTRNPNAKSKINLRSTTRNPNAKSKINLRRDQDKVHPFRI